MDFYINNTMSINETLSKMNEFDVLHLKSGTYKEKVRITKPNITIIGEGRNTIITNKDYFTKIDSNNFEYLTVRTYTLIVISDNVVLKDLTIQNESIPAKIYGQAVALEVLGDNFKGYNLNLLSDQDTLLAGPIPPDLLIRYKDILPKDELEGKESHQLYDNCYIEGGIDFIFGSATAFFNKCTLHSINDGFIAAPSHSKEQQYGFVFNECTISANKCVTNVYLARPWRDYGYTAYINCKVESNHINKALFNNWLVMRESTCRFYLLNTIESDNAVNFYTRLADKDKELFTQDKVLGFKD